ncbi:MAG: hypothetical protein AAF993_03240, partial [Pseudomonadota bacterium]
DSQNRDLTEIISHSQMNTLTNSIRKSTRLAVIKEIRPELERLLQRVDDTVQQQRQTLISDAHARVEKIVGGEQARLMQLQRVNPAIRDEEVEFFAAQAERVRAHIDNATLDLQAARVVIAT